MPVPTNGQFNTASGKTGPGLIKWPSFLPSLQSDITGATRYLRARTYYSTRLTSVDRCQQLVEELLRPE